MKQRLQLALSFARISQKGLSPVAALDLGNNPCQKMMLIGKSGNAQPVHLRTLDNASPMHRHRNVRVSDLFEWRIQTSMLSPNLNVSLKLLVQKSVVDCNHIATQQVRRDMVDGFERGLIEHRFINRSLDEYKLVAVETYQFLRSITDQTHRHCVQQLVGKMNSREWLRRSSPLNLIAKRLEPPALLRFQNWKWLEYSVAQRAEEFRKTLFHELEN